MCFLAVSSKDLAKCAFWQCHQRILRIVLFGIVIKDIAKCAFWHCHQRILQMCHYARTKYCATNTNVCNGLLSIRTWGKFIFVFLVFSVQIVNRLQICVALFPFTCILFLDLYRVQRIKKCLLLCLHGNRQQRH